MMFSMAQIYQILNGLETTQETRFKKYSIPQRNFVGNHTFKYQRLSIKRTVIDNSICRGGIKVVSHQHITCFQLVIVAQAAA